MASVTGVGKDAPTVVNAVGGKQSGSPYRMDLIPPLAAFAVASVLKEGADKYGDDNWKKITIPDHLNHALAHAFAYMAGDKSDDHLGHMACRVLFALDLAKGQDAESDVKPEAAPAGVMRCDECGGGGSLYYRADHKLVCGGCANNKGMVFTGVPGVKAV